MYSLSIDRLLRSCLARNDGKHERLLFTVYKLYSLYRFVILNLFQNLLHNKNKKVTQTQFRHGRNQRFSEVMSSYQS